MDVQTDGSGGAVVVLDDAEAGVLASLLDEQAELLRDAEAAGPEVARRLAPAAYPDDPLAEDDYRKLVDGQLGAERLSYHDMVVKALVSGRPRARASVLVAVPPGDVEAWLMTINHLRLVLGTQLAVQQDDDYEEVDFNDPASLPLQIYGWLGMLLESLIEAAGE